LTIQTPQYASSIEYIIISDPKDEEITLMSTFGTRGSGFFDKLRSGKLTTTFSLLAVLTVGILAGSVLTSKVSGKEMQHADSTDARPLTIPNPVTLSNGFSQIVKQVGPAVVNINTESLPKQPKHNNGRNGRRMAPQNPGGDDDQGGDNNQDDMQNFFNRFFGGGGGGQTPDNGPRRALGSGFIVDPRGYIITNNHVVDQADHIYVKLSTDPQSDIPGDPGRPATVVGVDKDTDIAVIKIDPKGLTLPVAKLGNSDGGQVGDWVLAIGSPFSLSQTVSAGIISAKDRSINDSGNAQSAAFQKFIQTDAAINPGNSGGPLVDMAGQVIGMNTAIYTESAGSEGIGFAMPSNTIINVYNMLISPEHKVTRGSIGIQFQSVQSSAVGRMYGFSNGGVLVSVVTPNGPAAKAGLQPDDVITSVDGTPVKDGDELIAIISAKKPGSTIRLGYRRNNKPETAEVGIADRAKLFADVLGNGGDDANGPAESDAGEGKLGIKVQALTPQQQQKLNLHGGVVVTDVRPGSFADETGLSKGYVIVEINKQAVTDETSYRNIVSGLKSGSDVVFVLRDPQGLKNGNTYVGGTLP
jgi:serine protease Do